MSKKVFIKHKKIMLSQFKAFKTIFIPLVPLKLAFCLKQLDSQLDIFKKKSERKCEQEVSSAPISIIGQNMNVSTSKVV